jgi:threonine aldolase
VFYDPAPLGLTYSEINEAARQLKEPMSLGDSRLVLHIQTSEEVVEDFIKLLERLKKAKASDLVSGQ